MSKWDDMVNRAVDKHGVSCRMIRLADPDVPGSADVEVSIQVALINFKEYDQPSGGDLTQQYRRYLIPAVRLRATGFPVPPRPGDRMIFADEVTTVKSVGPAIAAGAEARYDVEVLGL